MTKVAIVADVHVGNHKRHGGEMVGSINRRCRLALDVLRKAFEAAEEAYCTHFVVAGDLFDYARPEPAVLAAVQAIMEPYAKSMDIYLLVGNHDRTSTAPGDNALAPLAPFATVIETPRHVLCAEGASLLLVPFQAGPVADWLPRVVADLNGGRGGESALLVLHMGIKDAKTPPWLQKAQGAVEAEALTQLCEKHRIGHAVAGDWHDYRIWKGRGMPGYRPLLMQIGALAPTGWENPGIKGYGTVAMWEPRPDPAGPKLTRTEVPGPRFLKVNTSDGRDEAIRLARNSEHTIFISETCAPEALTERVASAESFTAAHPSAGAYEVVPDQAIAKAEARTAASLARSAETFDEALEAFVAAMPLDDDVNRARITARCKEYLR